MCQGTFFFIHTESHSGGDRINGRAYKWLISDRKRGIDRLSGKAGEIRPSVDLGCDFIMVYGIDPTMPERIRQYRKGYVIHLMTGNAWGEYQEYLDGKWDGRKHWDEGQVDRNGKDVIHNPTRPIWFRRFPFRNIRQIVRRLP